MDQPWINHLPENVPAEIDSSQFSSLVHMFEESVAKYADQAAFINMGATITYRKLEERSRAFAAYLQNELHLNKGDRVAIMMPNLLQYPIALFGALIAGLTVVNVNPLYTARELEHQLKDSGAKGILILENFAHVLQAVINNTDVKHVVTTSVGDRLGLIKGALINGAIKHVKKQVPAFDLPNAVKFNDAMSKGSKLKFTPVTITGEDLAFLQYTGGTTGPSKGAMLTHRNMVANLEQSNAVTKNVYEIGKEFMITALPLYHIYALTSNCLAFIPFGGTNLLITNPRDMPGFVKECVKAGLRTVMITHGRGKHIESPHNLMKSALCMWLPTLDDVLAFHSAQPQHGGLASLYLLLRKNEEQKLANKERHR